MLNTATVCPLSLHVMEWMTLILLDSSFRFLLKQVELVPVTGPTRSLTGTNMLRDGGEEVQYDWEFYGLHSFWAKLNGPETDSSSYSQVLLCFDFVDKMKSQTINMFGASNGEKIATVPFGVHDVLLEILTKQYDTALWGFRTPVRNYEKVCYSTLARWMVLTSLATITS